MGKLSKDRRDVFYRKAKEAGWRARSAYKLLHLNQQFDFINPSVSRVVDLCAAPGGWCQVIHKLLTEKNNLLYEEAAIPTPPTNLSTTTFPTTSVFSSSPPNHPGPPLSSSISSSPSKPSSISPTSSPPSEPRTCSFAGNQPTIIGVDLQVMAPLEGVTTIQGDITSLTTVRKVLSVFGGHLADLVLCDGSPDITGMHDMDEFVQGQLLVAALSITTLLLAPRGTFVAKVFRGENVGLLYMQLLELFEEVFCCKPASSRNSSLEAFVVCRGFKVPNHNQLNLSVANSIPQVGLHTPALADNKNLLPTGTDAAGSSGRGSTDIHDNGTKNGISTTNYNDSNTCTKDNNISGSNTSASITGNTTVNNSSSSTSDNNSISNTSAGNWGTTTANYSSSASDNNSCKISDNNNSNTINNIGNARDNNTSENNITSDNSGTDTGSSCLRSQSSDGNDCSVFVKASSRLECCGGNNSVVVPFIACGDLSGFDSDRTYRLDDHHRFLQPVQLPLSAPYLSFTGCTC